MLTLDTRNVDVADLLSLIRDISGRLDGVERQLRFITGDVDDRLDKLATDIRGRLGDIATARAVTDIASKRTGRRP
jgi:hypothetical protein